MQVNKVQSVNNNVVYKASLVDSAMLRKFEAGLNRKDKKLFDTYKKRIEESRNRNNYIFEIMSVGRFNNMKQVATISIRNKDKTIQHPPVFSEKVENALNLFKNLAESLK